MSDEPENNESALPEAIPVFLNSEVVFPLSIVPVRFVTESDTRLIDDVAVGDRQMAVLARRNGEGANIEGAYEVGVLGVGDHAEGRLRPPTAAALAGSNRAVQAEAHRPGRQCLEQIPA